VTFGIRFDERHSPPACVDFLHLTVQPTERRSSKTHTDDRCSSEVGQAFVPVGFNFKVVAGPKGTRRVGRSEHRWIGRRMTGSKACLTSALNRTAHPHNCVLKSRKSRHGLPPGLAMMRFPHCLAELFLGHTQSSVGRAAEFIQQRACAVLSSGDERGVFSIFGQRPLKELLQLLEIGAQGLLRSSGIG